MDTQLPSIGFLRLYQIIGSPKHPNIIPIIPVSKTCWWEGVKSGRFPQPVKIGGRRATFWRVTDIVQLIESV